MSGIRNILFTAAFVLALALGRAAAGAPKVVGNAVITDDSTTGTAASPAAAAGAGRVLQGTLGQVASEVSTNGVTAVEAGFFTLMVATPAVSSVQQVFASSVGVQWSAASPVNPAGADYRIELSTDSSFTGILLSSAAYGTASQVDGLSANTTYFARLKVAYFDGDETEYVPLDSHLTLANPPTGARFDDVGSFSAALSWDRNGNAGGRAVSNWGSVGSLPSAREGHAVAAYGRRVYVSGGVNGNARASVFWAAMQADGSLGPWNETTPLPAPRESHAMSAWGGRLYVAGGFDGAAKAVVWFAPILADGGLGEWRQTSPLPAARFKLAMAAHAGRLYVAGGDNGIFAQSSVYYAEINADGTLGPWLSGTSLPTARSGHAMAISSGTLYVAGGVVGAPDASVLWSPLAGGAPGAWSATASLPGPRTRAALAAEGGHLYTAGGHDGTSPRAEVFIASRNADGTLAPWSASAPLPEARYLHGMAAAGERLYLVGGSDGDIPLDGVVVSSLSGTEFLAERARDGSFTVDYASSGWRAGAAYEWSGLAPNTAYFSRVRARNAAAIESDPGPAVSTATLAAMPASALSTFTAVELSSIGVQWTSGPNPANTEFRAQASTSSDFGAALSLAWSTNTASVFTGLTANTSYYFRAQARSAALIETPHVSLGARFTLAAAPTASTITFAQTTGFTLAWSSGSNPPGTRYEAQAAVVADFSAVLASSVTLSSATTFAGLPSASTFYARVRALNGNGVATAFDAAVSTRTGLDAVAPAVSTGAFAFQSGIPNALFAAWVVAGDDGNDGDLAAGSSFYVQWTVQNPASIVWSTAAAQVVVGTGPARVGALASVLVPALPSDVPAFFRVWTRDEAGNYSAPSDTFTAHVSPFAFSRLDGAGADVGRSPTIAVDRFGNLHAAYLGVGSEVRYAKRVSGAWGASEAVDPGTPAAEPSIAVDNDGVPQIAYRDVGVPRVKLARFAGGWTSSIVEAGDFRLGALVSDADGRPQLSYYDATQRDLRFARWTGAQWTFETVASAGDSGRVSALALDASQTPYVAYSDDTRSELRIASRSASGWTPVVVDAAAVSVASSPALAVDAEGAATVAYANAALGAVQAARVSSTGAVAGVLVESGSFGSVGGLVLDGAGRPLVVYRDEALRDLRFARWTGTTFATGTVDSLGDQGAGAALAVDGSGGVHLAYYDATAGDLKAAEWSTAVPPAAGGGPGGRAQAPSGMAGAAVSLTQIQWSWTDNAVGESGYRLYGSVVSTGPFTLIAGTQTIGGVAGSGAAASYIENGLTANTTYYRYVVAVTSGGAVASKVAFAFPFDTVDIASPTITDNQPGDAAWRRAANAQYDVDFFDAGGSKLGKFQVKASTIAGGGGPDLIGFTDVVTGIGAETYSIDWTLPSAVFEALREGVTNYITVRAVDISGNAGTLADAFIVLKDTTPPSLADNQPGDSALRSSPGTLYDVDAFDGIGLAAFQYSVSTTAGAGDAAVKGWTDIVLPAGATGYLMDWPVDFAALISHATNYVSVRAIDQAGSTTTALDAFFILKDQAGPTVVITAPAAGFLSALTELRGTAVDISGVQGVELSVQESPPGGLYWNGAAFNSAPQVFFTAAGTASWTHSPGISWADGASYRIVVRASDTIGNFSLSYATANFIFDAAAPSVAVLLPVPNSTVSSLPLVTGTAQDPGAAPSGVGSVEVRLRRNSDGFWWNFVSENWSSVPVSSVPAGASSWSLSPSELLKANLAHKTSYFLAVRASDLSSPGNSGDFFVSGATFTFSDTTAPAAITDLTGSTATLLPGQIQLSWTAPGDDGTSGTILLGEYRIQYSTESGVSFGTATAQVAVSTSLVKPGTLRRHLVTGLTASATYFLRAWVADDAGNWSAVSNATVSVAAPLLSNQIVGRVMKVSSEGITAVEIQCTHMEGSWSGTVFTVADGSGTFNVPGMPAGLYRVQATWTSDGVSSSVWQDNIEVGTVGVDFVLQIDYTLATLQGTLQTLAAASRTLGYRSSAVTAQDFAESRVELFVGGRQAVSVPVSGSGRWVISGLLPGKYAVRAFDGLSYTDLQEVVLVEGEIRDVGFVFNPLPEDSVFAFPNPARNGTTFRFQTALSPLEAQVQVFDIAGNLVKDIPGTDMISTAPGLYHAPWNLTNSRGESVASGVYLFMVKVRGGAERQTAQVIKKLAVVK